MTIVIQSRVEDPDRIEWRREQIVRAAVRCFASDGYHRTPGDEKVRGVDYAGEAGLYKLIGRLRTERNLGILLVSHDLHIVMAQSDRIVCLNSHICCSGAPQSVAEHPEYRKLFGETPSQTLARHQAKAAG